LVSLASWHVSFLVEEHAISSPWTDWVEISQIFFLGEEDVNTFLTIMELFIQASKEPLLDLLFQSIIMIFHQILFLVD
jgi:predicted membrane-bound dolichyl-phosphate-mannose-protein mannosyltransferase